MLTTIGIIITESLPVHLPLYSAVSLENGTGDAWKQAMRVVFGTVNGNLAVTLG
jgi:hypothetical protein